MNAFFRSGKWYSFASDATRDFLVLVIGILVALWVDAWWQDRQDRDEERQALLGLQEEFRVNQSYLKGVFESLGEMESAARRLLTIGGKELSEAEAQSARRDVQAFFGLWTFSPTSGSLTALINSGKLGLIRNTDLRTRLAGWQGLVLDYKEEENAVMRIINSDLEPQLRRKGGPTFLLRESAPGRFEGSFAPMVRDLEFMNTVSVVVYWSTGAIDEAKDVDTATEEVLRLIEQELAR